MSSDDTVATEVMLNMFINEIAERVPDDAEVGALGEHDSEPYASYGPRTRAIEVTFADGRTHRVVISGSLIDDGAHPHEVALALSAADVGRVLRRASLCCFAVTASSSSKR